MTRSVVRLVTGCQLSFSRTGQLILLLRQKVAIAFCQSGQSLKTNPYESHILLIGNRFGQCTDMGLVEDRAVFGDEGQYCLRIACQMLSMTRAISITHWVTFLQVS